MVMRLRVPRQMTERRATFDVYVKTKTEKERKVKGTKRKVCSFRCTALNRTALNTPRSATVLRWRATCPGRHRRLPRDAVRGGRQPRDHDADGGDGQGHGPALRRARGPQGQGGAARARPHGRVAPPLIRFIPDSLR